MHSLPTNCITTWDESIRDFLAKFFPPSKTREAWEYFKDLLHLCPHYGLQQWMIIKAFYNGVTQAVRSTTDKAIGRTLMRKTEDEAYHLIEEMTLNNFQWSTERA